MQNVESSCEPTSSVALFLGMQQLKKKEKKNFMLRNNFTMNVCHGVNFQFD